jgi:uncharacterized LabA/DUF88 family protein
MGTVAMLIDWENIKASAAQYLGTPPDIVTLKKIARQYGSLTIARAYANWTDPTGWHAGDVERLSEQGIEPVFVWTRREAKAGGEPGEWKLYVSDMVDLRLACDCMELLAAHSEVSCYVVVSGDGALETLLAKLSAHGKRVVRVSVKQGLAVGMHVLGEERVLYDDWIRGFQVPIDKGPIRDALASFVNAVSALRTRELDSGLNAVKELMKRSDPTFDEEKLGIPTFRHLGYLAEARGMARIDGRREPARAYLENEGIAADGAFLPAGETWLQFVRTVDPRAEYNLGGLQALFQDKDLGGMPPKDFVDLASRSDVLTKIYGRFVTRDQKTGQAVQIPATKWRLNAHHPRVQVALSGVLPKREKKGPARPA